MGRDVFLYDPPESFVAKAIVAGGRTDFQLQARTGGRVTSVAVDEGQLQVLAERITALLDEMRSRFGEQVEIPDAPSGVIPEEDFFDAPPEPTFRVGSMGLGWNPRTHRLIIEAHAETTDDFEVPDLETDPPGAPPCLRVRLTGTQARDFATRATKIADFGPADCPFCNQPLNPLGHICPRSNGQHYW